MTCIYRDPEVATTDSTEKTETVLMVTGNVIMFSRSLLILLYVSALFQIMEVKYIHVAIFTSFHQS